MQEIRLSTKTNKLEQDPYTYTLQNAENPELFREMFLWANWFFWLLCQHLVAHINHTVLS